MVDLQASLITGLEEAVKRAADGGISRDLAATTMLGFAARWAERAFGREIAAQLLVRAAEKLKNSPIDVDVETIFGEQSKQ